MKVVILAGGRGTRLAEETDVLPKPMVEIGGRPILWHIMRHYAHYGFKEFVIALGYKGHIIKRYFADYFMLMNDLRIDLSSGTIENKPVGEEIDWVIDLIDTGTDTQTGGRIKRLQKVLGDEPFMLTYGDGVSDIPLDALLAHHKAQGKLITVSAVRPPARFGNLDIEGHDVVKFSEKVQSDAGWVHGGFMVIEPQVLDMIEGDQTGLEHTILSELARKGEMAAYAHQGFWMCMDTVRDKQRLQKLWDGGNPPWKVWT